MNNVCAFIFTISSLALRKGIDIFASLKPFLFKILIRVCQPPVHLKKRVGERKKVEEVNWEFS